MRAIPAFETVRLLVTTSVGAGLVAAALASCGESRDPGVDAATDVSTGDGWKTIDYRGVEVEIPAGWTAADMTSCEFTVERWTPVGQPPCSPDRGLAFYASATFDPAHGPGIRHGDPADDHQAWSGYVYAGDMAVYVADDDRDLVHHVLRSVSAEE